MERPFPVRAGLAAYIAGLVLGLISVIYQFTDLTAVIDDTAEGSNLSVSDPAFLRTVFIVVLVFQLAWYVIQGLFVYFAWTGRHWARVVLWVLGGVGIVFGVSGAFGHSYLPGFLQGLSFFRYVLLVAAVAFLAQRTANAWYRNRRQWTVYEGWLRATGQRR
jgi:hypothetical protein